MKVMFVEAKKNMSIDTDKIDFNILPPKILLAYSIQYKDIAEKIKKRLGKKIVGFKQVLGCSKLKASYPILLISSGRFHALQLALQDNVVYILEENRIKKLENERLTKGEDEN